MVGSKLIGNLQSNLAAGGLKGFGSKMGAGDGSSTDRTNLGGLSNFLSKDRSYIGSGDKSFMSSHGAVGALNKEGQ